MAKNKQRRQSYYSAGIEDAKTRNGYFHVNRGKRRYSQKGRFLNSGHYLRGVADGVTIQLNSGDPATISEVLWWVSSLPSVLRRYVIIKARIKVDHDGTPYVKYQGIKMHGTFACAQKDRPTPWERFKRFCGFY